MEKLSDNKKIMCLGNLFLLYNENNNHDPENAIKWTKKLFIQYAVNESNKKNSKQVILYPDRKVSRGIPFIIWSILLDEKYEKRVLVFTNRCRYTKSQSKLS
jgi:hypothetical protein